MIKVKNGDLMDYIVYNGPKVIIAHVVSNAGGFGKGFAKAVANRWPNVKQAYKTAYYNRLIVLGNVHMVHLTQTNISIANMVAQHGYKSHHNPVALRYDAFETCLDKVGALAKDTGNQVWMPYLIGCGLAGGDWDKVAKAIENILVNKYGIAVTLFKLQNQ